MTDNDAAASFISSDSWKSFTISANTFLQKTNEHVLQGLNPGGIYQAIWCRDASYILKDWFLSGNIDGAMRADLQNMVSSNINRYGEVSLW